MTLIQMMTGFLSYDSSFAVYAEKINGEFTIESSARFGQTCFENGGLLDDCEFFATNERIVDEIESWGKLNAEEASEMLISEINEAVE